MQTPQIKVRPLNTSHRTLGMVVSAFALVALALRSHATDGTWTNLMANGSASGSWAAATNWNNNVMAGGTDSTADFSTLDITNTTTVTLDGARTNGLVIIGDLAPSTNWTFNAGTPATSGLWMSASAGSPIINVSNRIATFGAAVFGANGFTKTGAGTLRLNVVNTNASGALSNLVFVSAGILQVGNAGAMGVAGNLASNDRTICTNGGTLEVINGVQPNNEHLTLSGTGLGGTNGALYALTSGNGTSTRWGLSSLNASGVSGNSSAAFPAISLVGDTTVRIDGPSWTVEPIGAAGPSFAIGHVSGTNGTGTSLTPAFTLTKTGGGRLSFDRGLSGITNLVVQEGSYMPNQGGAFGSIQYYTVASGAAILNNQGNNCFASSANIQLNAGSFFDINWRGNGNVGNDNTTFTQNIGYLNGAGLLTTGSRGNTNHQTLVINGAVTNSLFSGTIAVSNGFFHITKNGLNTLTLSGTNNYNGNSTVNAGTWLVDGRHAGGSNYVVAVGAVLGGKGTIISASGCSINLNGPGSFLVPGDNGGTLTVSNVTGAGDVIVSNANLTVLGQLNSSLTGQFLDSLYLTNSTTTALLQQNGTEASIYASTVNVDGANNILSYTTANPTIGQYPFIKYNSAIGGLNGFAGLQLVPPSGSVAYLSNNVANSSIDIVVTAIPALVWRGTPTGDWSIGGSANWLNVATPTAYTETAGRDRS